MSKTKTALFISGSSAADVLGGLGRAYRESFERLGVRFLEINFAKPGAGDALNDAIRELSIELAFGWIGAGLDLQGATPDGRSVNLWEGLGVPYISLYGDSPAYFFDRHVMPGHRFACLYGFPEHYALRKRLPSIKGVIGTIPASVVDPVFVESIDFQLKEHGKILFLKNGNDPHALIDMWRHHLSDSVFIMMTELASEMAGRLVEESAPDIDLLVDGYLIGKGIDIASVIPLRLFFIAQLDDYSRRIKSTMIAEALLDFPIEIHGDKWDHVDFRGRKARLVQGGDYERSKSLIRAALAILDMSPNTQLAPHDRPLRAMGMYTLFLTNEQQYFNDRFSEASTFSFRFQTESIQTKIADVIANPKRYVELGREISASYRKNLDYDEFCRHLLDIAALLRLGASPRFEGLQNYFAWPPEKLP